MEKFLPIESPVIGIIHNLKESRWHPVYFRFSPAPSGIPRHKSGGHHTNGFPSREEALANCNCELKEICRSHPLLGEPEMALSKDFPWDGEGVPAMVFSFGKDPVTGEIVLI